MKRFPIVILIIGSLIMFVFGCTEKKPTEPGVVDYITGAEQIKAYKKVKSKIEDINKAREERNQEIE